MSNEMIVPQGIAGDIANVDDEQFDKLVKSSSWLPRVQLMNGLSGLVSDGKMAIGHYALITDKENFADLTREFNCLVFCYRFKALRFEGGSATNCYDPNSKLWDDIVSQADVKDSGCSFGPEFLLWIPGMGFATYFANNKTARRESANIKTIIKEFATNSKLPAMTLKSSIKKGGPGGNKKWWGPDVLPCSTPFAESPDWDEVKAQSAKFRNPPKQTVEAVDASETSEDRD